ncbi:MAG: ferritin family protein [Deltaproteobacteria bacterium]|nr:ferritin family protein [Deltaproteobacteria bacterium]
MSDLPNIDEILDFAIDSEQAAVDLYTGLADQAKNPAIKKAFGEYANEERGHKAKLMEVKAGKRFLKSGNKPVLDLKISDYTVEEEPVPDADYQSVLIFAMKKEKAAFKLYTDLAGKTDDPALSELLLGLAQEEAKHKLRFEIEYDDNILIEN